MVPDFMAPDFDITDALPGALTTVPLRSNETEDVPDLAPGTLQLVFTSCLVGSRTSGAARRILGLRLTTSITKEEIDAGVARVFVGFHGFASIETVDANGDPLVRDHVFGVAVPEMSLEVKGPEGSPLHLLLPPGEYLAYLDGSHPVHVPFVVREHEEDAGTVTLRDPSRSGAE